MLSPVVEILSCDSIRSAQKRPPHASGNDMKAAVLSGRGDL
jgi:hypothetical protein